MQNDSRSKFCCFLDAQDLKPLDRLLQLGELISLVVAETAAQAIPQAIRDGYFDALQVLLQLCSACDKTAPPESLTAALEMVSPAALDHLLYSQAAPKVQCQHLAAAISGPRVELLLPPMLERGLPHVGLKRRRRLLTSAVGSGDLMAVQAMVKSGFLQSQLQCLPLQCQVATGMW